MSVCEEHGVERVRSHSAIRCPEHYRRWKRKQYAENVEMRTRELIRVRNWRARVGAFRSIDAQIALLDPRLQELINGS